MSYQPVKLTREQYIRLKNLVRQEWGNISVSKGIYILTHSYKYVPVNIKKQLRRIYWTSEIEKKNTLKKWQVNK